MHYAECPKHVTMECGGSGAGWAWSKIRTLPGRFRRGGWWACLESRTEVEDNIFFEGSVSALAIVGSKVGTVDLAIFWFRLVWFAQ